MKVAIAGGVAMVKIESLSFSYSDKVIFKDASLTIKDKKITALLAPSGEGKCTLAKLLTGCYKPNSGAITLDDKVLSTCEGYNRALGLSIALVYQNPSSSLDPSQRVISSITELIRYHKICDRSEEKLLIKKYIEELNLDEDILNHRPRQLSGGEAQRIALLKALLLKPRLLILDEATSMLDVSTQANVISLAIKAIKEINGSILLITHDKELAAAISDEIYIIQGNKFRRKR